MFKMLEFWKPEKFIFSLIQRKLQFEVRYPELYWMYGICIHAWLFFIILFSFNFHLGVKAEWSQNLYCWNEGPQIEYKIKAETFPTMSEGL